MITVDQITLEAFPKDTCRFKESHKKEQREVLKNRINQYLSEQLSLQFNAKPVSSVFELRVREEGS